MTGRHSVEYQTGGTSVKKFGKPGWGAAFACAFGAIALNACVGTDFLKAPGVEENGDVLAIESAPAPSPEPSASPSPSRSPSPSPPANRAPTANAGLDKTITLPTNFVTLSGSGSDPDGSSLAYQWSKVSGGSASLGSVTSAQLSLTGLVAGTYTFRLTVKDPMGASGADDAKITVNPAPNPSPSPTVSAAPPPSGGGTLSLHEADSKAAIGTTCGYGVYLPPGYTKAGKWPFLVFLHGIGENNIALTKAVFDAGGPMHELKTGHIAMNDVKMVVLQPQQTGYCKMDTAGTLATFINWAIDYYGLDRDRFYLTGLSAGGGGTHVYLNTYYTTSGAAVPSAAIPLSANGGFKSANTPQQLVNDRVAIWSGTSLNDSAFAYGGANTIDPWGQVATKVSGIKFVKANYPFPGQLSTLYFDVTANKYVWTPGMTSKVEGVDIDPPYLLTVWPGTGHGSPWAPMYSSPEVYRWLLKHSRN